VARYREELRRHADRHEAMAVALHRAGPAIVASAATVIAGMLCLLVADSADIQPDDKAAYATIGRVRTAAHAVPGADAKVGGGTAITLDVERYATRDRNVIIPLVLLVVLVILGLLLQSVVAPLVLIGTVVLSFGAALGLSALAFRYLSSPRSVSP
jgi:RND superfamily putative drug exporter